MSELNGFIPSLERATDAMRGFRLAVIGHKVTDMQYPKSAGEKRLEEAQDAILRIARAKQVLTDYISDSFNHGRPHVPARRVALVVNEYDMATRACASIRRSIWHSAPDATWRPRFGQAAEFLRIVEGGR